ncbi:MAG: carboxypeptidase-like regulatory domain-containing protein [Rhodothermales bacterium]
MKTSAFILIFLLCSAFYGEEVRAQHSASTAYEAERSEDMAERMQAALLADALLKLAESRQLEIAYAPELLVGKTSDCPILPEDDEKAVQCILEKSGLLAQRLMNGVFVIQKPSGEQSVYKGGINGRVLNYHTGTVLSNAHVMVAGTPYSTASGLNGTFNIDHIPPGLYDVEVSIIGYESHVFRQIHVIAGQSVAVDLNLNETTFPMEEVLITSDKERRRMSLPDTLNPLGFQGFRLGRVSAGLFMSTSPTPVNGVQFGGLGNMVRDSLKGVQFGGVFNSAQSAQGVQFGGVFNTVYGDLDGYQFSGVLNQLGGDLEGGQFAGTVNTASNMRGAQFGGIANLADGRAKGVQASGIVNVAGDMAGTQMAGVANRANRTRGFQGAGVLNMSGPLRGAQAAGIANIAIGDFRGLQAAGIMNVAGNTRKGVQMSGILNVVDNMDGGVQIGLVNIANRNTGLPLGLLSYVKETGLKFDVWADEMGIVSTAVRSGNRSFSNYLGVAARPGESFDNQALMMGLGGEFALRPRLYSSVDVLYYLFGVESSNVSGPDEHLAKMRLLLGFKIAPRIAIFGGPSLNLFISDHQDTNVPVPSRLIDTGRWSGADYSVWAGYAFGLRISTKP